MKKSEEKKLEKFQVAKLTAEQQVEVKGGDDIITTQFIIRDDIAGI
ncbi:MAG: hypothetical protein HUU01_08240 [Saprospiraceae bacterium]|nr:hypothetical protein [Saprospiraceae bacterium]